MNNKKLFILELNEINFDLIKKYIDVLPTFKKILKENKLIETLSEDKLENVEPWILWPSIHTGLSYNEHKLFNLNDYNKLKYEQIWEKLEKKNLNIAAISPMNAKDNFGNKSFYLPDPWSNNIAKGSFMMKLLKTTTSYFVNNNAGKDKKLFMYLLLLLCFLRYANFINYYSYIRIFISSIKKKWFQSIFLDLLLFDFSKTFIKKNFNFITLFLNGGAHIQHHYLFNSKLSNNIKNKSWYLDEKYDPVMDIYKYYDKILKQSLNIVNNKNMRMIIMTALSQDLVQEDIIYYRLKKHEEFLNNLNIIFDKVDTLMSRDFKIFFSSELDKKNCQIELNKIYINKEKVFTTKIYENFLFVQLVYKKSIDKMSIIKYKKLEILALEYFDLVAVKNGMHNPKGFLLDTENRFDQNIYLKNINNKIIANFI